MNMITVYEKLRQNSKNIRFNEVCSAAELLVIDLKREKEATEYMCIVVLGISLIFRMLVGGQSPIK